jgi:hypothetical protein
MRNIRRRLKELSKTFPPLTRIPARSFCRPRRSHTCRAKSFHLRSVNAKRESSPVQSLSEPESRALEAYYAAHELESRQARLVR